LAQNYIIGLCTYFHLLIIYEFHFRRQYDVLWSCVYIVSVRGVEVLIVIVVDNEVQNSRIMNHNNLEYHSRRCKINFSMEPVL